MHCRSPGPHPGGKLRGLAWVGGGGVSRPTPRGEVEVSGLGGGVSRPTPRGEVEGSGFGGGVSRPTPGFFFHKSYSLCGTVNDKGFYHAYTLFLHLGKVATTDRCYDCACIIYIYIYIYIF